MQKTIFALIYILILNNVIMAKEMMHLVKKGETLYSISRLYNVSLDDILVANKIEDPSKIKAGYNLTIPSKTIVESKEYKVEKGDTLYGVAKKHNVSINDLLSENNFDKDTIIKVGQIIKIPIQPQNLDTQIAVIDKRISFPDTGNSYAQYYWPVKGEMEKLSGKLQGSKISANYGDAVYSVSSGKVVWEGPYRGFGRVIFIESISGYVYVYGGNDRTNVIVGDSVEPGSELGKIGLNVHENKPTMFFAVYKDGKPIDVEKAPRL